MWWGRDREQDKDRGRTRRWCLQTRAAQFPLTAFLHTRSAIHFWVPKGMTAGVKRRPNSSCVSLSRSTRTPCEGTAALITPSYPCDTSHYYKRNQVFVLSHPTSSSLSLYYTALCLAVPLHSNTLPSLNTSLSHIAKAISGQTHGPWTEDPVPLMACVCVALRLVRVLLGDSVLRVQGSPLSGRDERGSQASNPASQPPGLAKDNTDMTAELQVGSVLHRVESGCILVSLKVPHFAAQLSDLYYHISTLLLFYLILSSLMSTLNCYQ
jgi:hypothetical protein